MPVFGQAGSGQSRARPVGLGFRPTGASRPYSPQLDIPVRALLLSGFDRFAQAVSEARRQGAGLIIDRVCILDERDLAQPNVALYGKGPGRLIYGGVLKEQTPCLMYAVDGDVTARGVVFEGFGDVFGGCAGSVDRGQGLYAYQTVGAYGFVRGMPRDQARSQPGQTRRSGSGRDETEDQGVGLALSAAIYSRRKGVIGPSFDLSDCSFINCERVLHLQSDSLHFGPLRLDRVVCRGTFGVVDQNCTVVADTYAFNLDYADCKGARAQPSNNSHGMHTAFKIGVDRSPDWQARPVVIRIENCRFADIDDGSLRPDSNCNSAVGVDIRNALAANVSQPHDPLASQCDIYVGYNQFERLRGLRGNEDCNAIYAKCFGLVVEGNDIIECGSQDARRQGGGDGAEATGVLLKDPWGGYEQARDLGVFVAVRGNRFVDMPGPPASRTGPLYVIKLSDMAPIAAYVTGNEIVRTHSLGMAGAFGLICIFGPTGPLVVASNHAVDCDLGPGRFIALKSFKQAAGLTARVFGNQVSGGRVDTQWPDALIYVDGQMPSLRDNFRLGPGGRSALGVFQPKG